MSNIVVMPILIPLATAVLLMFMKENIKLQRVISFLSGILNITISIILINRISADGILTLHMGGWLPPYGIILVGDMLAGLLVLMSAVVSFAILIYSFYSIGEDRQRNYFYTFFQFMLVGVFGSFLTGDIFNLFVFFEVMLISSYALIILGGTRIQLKETVKYLLVNILSSTLFLAAVAYLYAAVGTLNMAHLSMRVAEVGQSGVLNVIAIMFLIVFSVKAGLFLFFWLPGSYGAPPAAVRALFAALLTKVGLYVLIRMFTLIFYHDPGITHTWIAWMAGATMLLGGLGAVAYNDIPRILNYNVVLSVGFVAFGLVAGNADSYNGAVFYLLHDMAAKGMLFILGGIIITTANSIHLKEMSGLIKRYPLIGWMFFILSMALVGVPPLSGFAGKVLLIRGGMDAGFITLSLIGLASSFLVLYSLMKVFRLAFWGDEKDHLKGKTEWFKGSTVAASLLFMVVILMGIGSEWVYTLVSQAGEVLAHPSIYIDAVMKES